MNEESVDLFVRLRHGDDPAADEIFRRYMNRLTALARTRLSSRLAQRLDPEDVVLSAFRSFFVRARDGEFSLQRSGDLWRLLVAITLHKLHRQVTHHRAERRSMNREVQLSGDGSIETSLQELSASPTVEEVLGVADELEAVMSQLPKLKRRVLELRLQDYRLDEISVTVKRSERTVRRILEEVHGLLQRRLFPFRPDLAESPVQIEDEPRQESLLQESHQLGRSHKLRKTVRPRTGPVSFDPRAPLTHHDFLIQVHLGTGGMGRVYRALQHSLNKPVAIKVLKKIRERDAAAVERFLDEARIVARLIHPGIVGVHGIGRMPAGGHFLVMDLIDGPDLSQLMTQREVDVAEVIEWGAEVADTIAYAHAQGIVHCDLKPANILLDAQDKVHVTDFGLAKSLIAGLNVSAGFGGTLGYMAPEQAAGLWTDVTPQTDVYGLGALLYGLLTARAPFVGSTMADVFRQILTTEPAPLSNDRSDVPDQLSAIILKCLQKSVNNRYPSATDVAHALRQIGPS